MLLEDDDSYQSLLTQPSEENAVTQNDLRRRKSLTSSVVDKIWDDLQGIEVPFVLLSWE